MLALGQTKAQYYAEIIMKHLLGQTQVEDRRFPITAIQSFIFQIKVYTPDNQKSLMIVLLFLIHLLIGKIIKHTP